VEKLLGDVFVHDVIEKSLLNIQTLEMVMVVVSTVEVIL
jgi:hypothetical protein